MTVIIGYCESILRRLPEQDPIHREITEVKTAGERAAALTKKLLAFARRQVARHRLTDLTIVMAEMQELLRRLIGEDIEFVTTVEPCLGLVKVDEGQIGQVIMNLAVNARDAMAGGGTLTIQLVNISLDGVYARSHLGVRQGRYVMLSVSDTGCGMNPETQARMFDPFFTTKEQGRGTGLGLSTVYGIVNEHGGHVSVESAVGMGTTIKVYLPTTAGTVEASIKGSNERERSRATETILLVEDDDQLRRLSAQILQAEGYTVLEAENGCRAILILEDHNIPIHLMLTDVVMPGINGLVLAEKMMSLRACNAVLFMSGYVGDGTARQDAIPTDALLVKPFTRKQLLDAVRRALKRNEQALNRGASVERLSRKSGEKHNTGRVGY